MYINGTIQFFSEVLQWRTDTIWWHIPIYTSSYTEDMIDTHCIYCTAEGLFDSGRQNELLSRVFEVQKWT